MDVDLVMQEEMKKDGRVDPTVRLEKIEIFHCRICTYASQCSKTYVAHCMSHMFQSKVVLSRAIYQCDKCPKAFVDKGDLKLHHVLHVRQDVNKKLKKMYDQKMYPSSGKYKKRYKCDECDMRFVLESTLKLHSLAHEPFPYLCRCGIGYYKLNDLIGHEKLVHPKKLEAESEVNVRKVIYKDDDFSDESLKQESKNVYKTKNSKKKKRKTPRIQLKSKLFTGKRRIKCVYCSVEFESRADLKIHFRSHTELPYACYICCSMFDTQDLLDKHNQLHNVTCTYCNKVFKSKSNCQIHMRIHTNTCPYKCSVCSKSFKQFGALTVHMKIHTGIKDFKCDYCDKVFICKTRKISHERTHTGEKPHVCKYCNKPFGDPSALLRHIRIHTKDYRYHCDLCDKKFTDVSGLKNHRLRHGKKTYKCEQCNKKFYQKYDLQNHLTVHSDSKEYECNECGKKFSRKPYLILHIQWSHALRQECADCGKKLNNTSELKKHIRDCHGLVLYCSKCPKSFRLERSFKAHKNRCLGKKNSQKG